MHSYVLSCMRGIFSSSYIPCTYRFHEESQVLNLEQNLERICNLTSEKSNLDGFLNVDSLHI